MSKQTTYTVTFRYEAHDCGICGPSSMAIAFVTDGTRKQCYRQSACDNSDPITPASALESFLWENEEAQHD